MPRRNPALVLLSTLVLLTAGSSGRSAVPADRWEPLDRVAQEAVAAGNVPGVVFLVGHRGKVVYRKAFGNRSVRPERRPMTPDTVFDMASLTKVVATTSAVMALVQDAKLRLNDPVVRYWPEFGQNGKERITIRQLMTHTSGLASFENFERRFNVAGGPAIQDHREKVVAAIAGASLRNPADTRFVYSDLGYITLGEVVRRVSGEPLDVYVKRRVFLPLGMKETGFNPGPALSARAAPTTSRNGHPLQGQVHDPNAAMLGGVAGHAGLFSTADDLARFAWMLLSSDRRDGKRYPLSPATVRQMTTPQSPLGLPVRGLGWDIDSPYSGPRGDLFPLGSFGHTGFTGTSIWVDPYGQTFIIGLSNSVHPDDKGSTPRMRALAANAVYGILHPYSLPPRPALEGRPAVPAGQ